MKISKDSKYNFGEKNSIYQAKDMVQFNEIRRKKIRIHFRHVLYVIFSKIIRFKEQHIFALKMFHKK